jgi:NADPH2:quinone reductase
MRAIRVPIFGGPEVMKWVEVPDPVPGLGQVIVHLKAVGVNPLDTYIRSGAFGPHPFPYTPGSDGAGVTETGKRVYITGSLSGTYGEKALCNEAQIHPLPDTIGFSQGAAIPIPYATGYRALFQKACAQKGETVLIHGASGGVGLAAVQWASGAGLTIIGTAGTEKGLALIRKEGAHHALNHHGAGYLKQLMDLTGGKGVDIILEMLSNVNLGNDLTIAAKGGRVVVIGCRGPVEINPRDTMTRDITLYGMSLFNTSLSDWKTIHRAVATGLKNGSLRPVVGQEIPLAEAARAHEAVLAPGAYGKIVLIP